ncbi:Plant intracellular Ras-group-related LRR protein 6 [Glycine soja]
MKKKYYYPFENHLKFLTPSSSPLDLIFARCHGSNPESGESLWFSQPLQSLPHRNSRRGLPESGGARRRRQVAAELQKLILAHNSIASLKEDLRNLPFLSVLNLSHNSLSQLPAAIGELPQLKMLDVSFNSIVKIPEEIGSAVSLVKLDCSNNRLTELPSSLGRCLELSDLKGSNNLITNLPEDLANCSKLSKLDMEVGNRLTVMSENLISSWTMLTEFNSSKNLLNGIPTSIGGLSRLIRLDLHQNRISAIPSSIIGCHSLTELYLGNNNISTLPVEIGALSRLGTLDLHSNQLKDYPVEACKLSLLVLDLSNNSLSGLPPEMGKMTTLRKLLLSGNPMRTLRSSLVSGPTPALLKFLRSRLSEDEDSEAVTTTKEVITMATRLSISSKELSMEELGLSAVPSEVWESGEVIKLNLSRNSIQELPVELSSCVSLQTLILSKNQIKDWPGSILKSLSSLSCLKLDNNPLRQIPSDGFEMVPKLQILDLSGNAASLLDGPAFSSLPYLQELYLRRMRLSEVPSDIVGLHQLRILDLSQNSLQSIPVGLKALTSLQELDLSNNNIAVLPPELGLLEPSLQALRLDGNPLRSFGLLPLLLPLRFTSSDLNHQHHHTNNIIAAPSPPYQQHHRAIQATLTPTDLCATTPPRNGEVARAQEASKIDSRTQMENLVAETWAFNRNMEANAASHDHEDQDEYVLLNLDGVSDLIDIPPNAKYVLTIGEYEETIGTCIAFTEQEAAVVHEETGPSEVNIFSGTRLIDSSQAPTTQVKPVCQLHKVLKFKLSPDSEIQNVTAKEAK